MNNVTNKNRRRFIKTMATGWVLANTHPLLALNNTNSVKNKKLVWVMLRGALDSLHTVIPVGDPDLLLHRTQFLSSIKDRLRPLNDKFSLHPDLPFLHSLYKRNEMSPIVAVASGYRTRSHFDAQDNMESGLTQTNHDSGWLSRALQQYSGNGIAIARSIPIALRGDNHSSSTWYPSTFPEVSEDVLAKLHHLYADDANLHDQLEKVVEQKANPAMRMEEVNRPDFTFLAQRCGELLSKDNNMHCGMLEMGGWDTHNNQVSRLSWQFVQLDAGLNALKDSLGDEWQNTMVIVSTEFGRTVAINGTRGTDHGTASSMFVLGGAMPSLKASSHQSTIKGGKVLGSWPGLAPEQLFEGRDIMPNSDVRTWFGEVLTQHWGLTTPQLNKVFPDLFL